MEHISVKKIEFSNIFDNIKWESKKIRFTKCHTCTGKCPKVGKEKIVEYASVCSKNYSDNLFVEFEMYHSEGHLTIETKTINLPDNNLCVCIYNGLVKDENLLFGEITKENEIIKIVINELPKKIEIIVRDKKYGKIYRNNRNIRQN